MAFIHAVLAIVNVPFVTAYFTKSVPRQIVDRGRTGRLAPTRNSHVASGIVIDHACSAHYGQRGIFHTFPVREVSRCFCAVIGVATIATPP